MVFLYFNFCVNYFIKYSLDVLYFLLLALLLLLAKFIYSILDKYFFNSSNCIFFDINSFYKMKEETCQFFTCS